MSEPAYREILNVADIRELPELSAKLYVVHTEKLTRKHWNFLRSCLCEKEHDKASHFRFAEDQNSYIAAHGLCRIVLSEIVGVSPEAVQFTEHKKPKLQSHHNDFIDFSLSHTKGCVAICVSNRFRIGVDVEPSTRELPPPEVWLSQDERKHLAGENLIALWCVKEAISKALGIGASYDFRNLNVAEYPLTNISESFSGKADNKFYVAVHAN